MAATEPTQMTSCFENEVHASQQGMTWSICFSNLGYKAFMPMGQIFAMKTTETLVTTRTLFTSMSSFIMTVDPCTSPIALIRDMTGLAGADDNLSSL